MKNFLCLLAIVSAFGCASVAVTQTSLEERTSFALGLKKEDFTISNRQDSGTRTDYSVRTKSGAQYQCYVTGTVYELGRVVSDAVCNQIASAPVSEKPVTTSKPSDKKAPAATPACNALLKAANKC